jgi:UDP-N-acetylglucosamine:LPS N-acetylglucosamine transferase
MLGIESGGHIFRKLLSSRAVYDAFHFSQLRDDRRLGRAAERAAIIRMRKALVEELGSFRPELVVPVFATGAGAAADLKAHGHRFRSLVIMPDSFSHGMWVHEQTDLFMVTSRLAAESVRRYWPEAPVEIVHAPVRAAFATAPSRPQARAELGVPPDATCALLMSGAWGFGPPEEVAVALAEDGMWVLAVAATNVALERTLRRSAEEHQEIIPFGFTDRVPALMAASDVVVTSSGNTCREARSLGRGLVLLDVVPGHGRENLTHELELGGSTACQPTAASVGRAVRSFLNDPERSEVAPPADAGLAQAQFVQALHLLGFDLSSGGSLQVSPA